MSPRRGPRPLPAHLILALSRAWLATASIPSAPGSTAWSASWPGFAPRSPEARAEHARILRSLDGADPERLRAAVIRQLLSEDAAMLRGILAYRDHPWHRTLPDPPAIWSEGPARLLDHGGQGPVALFVPSLVNRATVLDLMPEHSMLRWMAGQGIRTLLLDWGAPGPAERGFTLTDWIAGRLERVIAAATEATGGAVTLVGYCMGGLLTLAAALRRPDRVRALALLATPWDFHAGGPEAKARARFAASLLPGLEPLMAATGTLPLDLLQLLFAGIDPFGIARKFRAFGRLDPASPRAAHFVALEDWLNDGIPLPAPVARECLSGWYGANTPQLGQWRVAGAPVEPAAWRGPAFLAIPRGDRIVPPESARALAGQLPGAAVLDVPAGHIGMAAGLRAEAALWIPLRDWIKTIARPS
ncbi:alpha/beta fold hydrolase [Roseomonas xinghualingensis]|uniref:alpha/beta fold hydrolase n=1 Tax=Roseomonas xinghualingensis TaxID=2986475 RepID=UPI0021F1F85A|nr:alpha/beta fold hydrolase [Roseomonas sp. SXEYE001]MCV4206024.1 alpha/beta fold hydrolase [Roseomonas sp. SXEYE001]